MENSSKFLSSFKIFVRKFCKYYEKNQWNFDEIRKTIEIQILLKFIKLGNKLAEN